MLTDTRPIARQVSYDNIDYERGDAHLINSRCNDGARFSSQSIVGEFVPLDIERYHVRQPRAKQKLALKSEFFSVMESSART